MTIRAQGQLRWTDYLRSQYLHVRPRRSFAIVGAVLLLLFAWASYETTSSWLTGVGSWVLPAIFAGALLYFVTLFAVIIPLNTHRIFKQQKSLNLPFSIEASSDSFCTFNEYGRIAMPWSHFVKWKENREYFLLYHSDALYNLVPKRFLGDDAQQSQFRGFLAEVRRVG